MQNVLYRDLDTMDYLSAWNYQEALLQENVRIKSTASKETSNEAVATSIPSVKDIQVGLDTAPLQTVHYLLLMEHPPVYTLGKSGLPANLLITEQELKERGIDFYKTNRGGDITFHGPEQLVGYPILDLEKFYKDIGRYLRDLEEVIIRTLLFFGLKGERSSGETGVWMDPSVPGKARKICAMGVRCSRWITMHGFALNVNTDLRYFNDIVPCGIQGKQVTSLQKELGIRMPMPEVKKEVQKNFEEVFNVRLV